MSTKLCLRRLARWKWNALRVSSSPFLCFFTVYNFPNTALSLAATTAAIQNSVQKLAATTRLGVKKTIFPN